MLLLFCYSHQFYLHAKLELCEGRLRPTDNLTICKTIALLAQAELGSCDDLVALMQFYNYWCEHLGVSMDEDDESIDRVQKLYSEMKVCIKKIFCRLYLNNTYLYIYNLLTF